ncbi:Hypothetical predicted protein [Mytilus galloprovincialis]|uniref:Uncharacterized protein n=1 Tax=Mytilus galloprovincialis TaxID=29158 RepID=A0A8B6GX67_MYTGA|nr:Hypothetical predicted protein [Mytilus galloprovincialis]
MERVTAFMSSLIEDSNGLACIMRGALLGSRAGVAGFAKKDKDKSTQPTKRTRSDVSTDSNTSMDLSGIINFQKDLDEIKFSLRDVTTKDDLNEVTKDLVKTADLENMVTGIVNNF